MDARAKLLGHSVHQMLIVFPLGLLRTNASPPPDSAYVCSFLGAGLALVTAWLGGELVVRLGVGVHEGANVNAPSSLSTREVPAHRL